MYWSLVSMIIIFVSYDLTNFSFVDGVWRGNKFINLKEIADEACAKCETHGHQIIRKFVVRHMGPIKACFLT